MGPRTSTVFFSLHALLGKIRMFARVREDSTGVSLHALFKAKSVCSHGSEDSNGVSLHALFKIKSVCFARDGKIDTFWSHTQCNVTLKVVIL